MRVSVRSTQSIWLRGRSRIAPGLTTLFNSGPNQPVLTCPQFGPNRPLSSSTKDSTQTLSSSSSSSHFSAPIQSLDLEGIETEDQLEALLTNMTVVLLKQFCREAGLKISGRKLEIIKRLCTFIAKPHLRQDHTKGSTSTLTVNKFNTFLETLPAKSLLLYCDGSSQPNPGPSALGIYADLTALQLPDLRWARHLGVMGNNNAELFAVCSAAHLVARTFGIYLNTYIYMYIFMHKISPPFYV